MAGFFKRREADHGGASELRAQVEALSWELAEARFLANQWRDEVQKARGGFSSHVDEAVEGRVERLLTVMGPMLARLESCAQQGQGVPAPLANELADALRARLKDYGASFEGVVGEAVPFDPARHELRSASLSESNEEQAVGAGQPVVVRVAGFVFKHRLVVKAAVERG